MNVLAKIVIPRLLLSIAYILSELEEKAREEFFRMKKIVQVKKKKRIKPKTAELKHVCEGCILCGAPKKDVSFIPVAIPIQEAIEDPIEEDKLANFKKQIADIIEATNELEQRNLLDEADNFVEQAKILQSQLQARKKYAEELRTKLVKFQKKRESEVIIECPDFIPAGIEYNNLCAKCQLTYVNQYGLPTEERKSSLISPPYSPPTSPLQQGVKLNDELHDDLHDDDLHDEHFHDDYLHNDDLHVDELHEEELVDEGIYETEIEVITKIIRKIHPDGSITEDKKVIKIRRETKKPLPKSSPNADQTDRKGRIAYRSSESSYGSGLYHDRKNVGYVVPHEMTPFRKLYSFSEIRISNSSMCCPVARYCVSIPNIIRSSEFDINKDVVHEFKTTSEKFEHILDQYEKSRSGNITTTVEYDSSLSKSDTVLLALLSEDNNFNFKSISHFSLYNDIMVIPDLEYKSCIDVINHSECSKNEK